MGNDPVNLVDPSGGIAIPCPGSISALSGIMSQVSTLTMILGITSNALQIASTITTQQTVIDQGSQGAGLSSPGKVSSLHQSGEVNLESNFTLKGFGSEKRSWLRSFTERSKLVKFRLEDDANDIEGAPWMIYAESQLGVSELTGNNDGPEVDKYLKTIGLAGSGQAWCGAFVNWTLSQAGIKGVSRPGWALNWRHYGRELDQPAFGSIATMKRKGGGHVGFVAGVTSSGRIVLLGGNQADKVKYESFPSDKLKYNYPKGYKPNFSLQKLHVDINKRVQ